jgi:hypothetical protein
LLLLLLGICFDHYCGGSLLALTLTWMRRRRYQRGAAAAMMMMMLMMVTQSRER